MGQEIDRVQQWLAAEIGATSAETQADRITLCIEDREYTVEIDPDFLAAYPGEQAVAVLRRWDLPGELCRAEGLRFIVTPAGVRLASSN